MQNQNQLFALAIFLMHQDQLKPFQQSKKEKIEIDEINVVKNPSMHDDIFT